MFHKFAIFREYKLEKIELELKKTQIELRNLNEKMNLKTDSLISELRYLQKDVCLIGEIIKPLDEKKYLIKINSDGKFLSELSNNLRNKKIEEGDRVAIRSEDYQIQKVLPKTLDSSVSLMIVEKNPLTNYESIGGLDHQIEQIREVVELPLRFPEIFESLGVSQPKGVLLYGPPGTGKTLLARAVANQANCTFIKISGSELVQKYIGEGSRLVREIFSAATIQSPSVIFMDEIDSIGSSRGYGGLSNGDSEVQRTMLELLNQLDGFSPISNVKVLMATNRLDVLDPALIRPGRIDRKIKIPNPNIEGRLAILKIHFKNVNISKGIDLWLIAKKLENTSGADLKSICMESGMSALRCGRACIEYKDIKIAIDRFSYSLFNNATESLFL
jgi:26S proteasome regulatory subunit T6